jgi:hypothetical protein
MHQSSIGSMPSFAFPHAVDSPDYLAMKDQLDVGPLSRRVTRTRIPAITAEHSLFPTSQTRIVISVDSHQAVLPEQGQYGVSTFR